MTTSGPLLRFEALCLDTDAAHLDQVAAFWSTALGWGREPRESGEEGRRGKALIARLRRLFAGAASAAIFSGSVAALEKIAAEAAPTNAKDRRNDTLPQLAVLAPAPVVACERLLVAVMRFLAGNA